MYIIIGLSVGFGFINALLYTNAFLSIHQCFSFNSSKLSIIFIQPWLGLTLWGWSVGKRHLWWTVS